MASLRPRPTELRPAMRLTAKVGLVAVLFSLVCAALVIADVTRIEGLHRASQDVHDDAMVPALELADIRMLLVAKRDTAVLHVATADPTRKRRYAAEYRKHAAALRAAVTQYERTDPAAAVDVADLRAATQEYDDLMLQLYLPLSSRGDTAAVDRLRGVEAAILARGQEVVGRMLAHRERRATALRQEVERRHAEARLLLVGPSLAVGVLGIGLTMWGARSVATSFKHVEWVVAGLAEGDLNRASDL